VKYLLSNRQRNQLLVRNVGLVIAIPVPFDDPEDWIEWARYCLGESGQWVVGVETMDVCCVYSGADGLNGVIGEIVASPPEHDLYWYVSVAAVLLDPPGRTRHPRERLQWPAFAVTPFGNWPREAT